MKSLRILSAALIAAVSTLALTAVPASAHASLVSSDPEDGAVVQEAPGEVVLEFSEAVDKNSTEVALTGADGTAIALAGDLEVDGVTLTLPISLPAAGEYQVAYRIVSVDGHPVEGSISFTAESVPAPTASPSQTEPGSAEPTQQTVAPDATQAKEGSVGWTPVLIVAAAVILVVGAAVLLLRRRSRRS